MLFQALAMCSKMIFIHSAQVGYVCIFIGYERTRDLVIWPHDLQLWRRNIIVTTIMWCHICKFATPECAAHTRELFFPISLKRQGMTFKMDYSRTNSIASDSCSQVFYLLYFIFKFQDVSWIWKLTDESWTNMINNCQFWWNLDVWDVRMLMCGMLEC